jgi:TusA-related sulfurtransferase
MDVQLAKDEEKCEELITAISQRSADMIASCLQPEVCMRALVPSGFQEHKGAKAVVTRFNSWFAEAESIEILEKKVDRVAGRLRIRYRFEERYSDGDTEVIEQEAYCEVADGKIAAIDLLCSGHLPGPSEKREDITRFNAGDLGCGSGLPEEFRRHVEAIAVGSKLETVAVDPSAREDLPSLARLLGHEVLSVRDLPDGAIAILVRRVR